MKHLTKYLSILLTAAILLTGCQAQGAADNSAEEQTTEESGVTLSKTTASAESSELTFEQTESSEIEQTESTHSESAKPDEITEPKQSVGRFEGEFDGVKFSLNDKPFGLDFRFDPSEDLLYACENDTPFLEVFSVAVQYSESIDEFAEYVGAMAADEKREGEYAVDYLDITQTDSGQSVLAFSQYIYGSDDNDASYALVADCGNDYSIYIYVALDDAHNTPEAREETLALFRSLEWELTDPGSAINKCVFEFEDIKFSMKIPASVDYVKDEYSLEQTAYKRCVQLVGQASFGNENSVTMSYFECDNTFEDYELEYLRNIEELSGGTMKVVDPIDRLYPNDFSTRAYKWSYRVDNLLFVAAYYLIDDYSWILVDYLVGDESQKEALEESLESFEFLQKPEPKYAALDLSKSERPEVTRVEVGCNASIINVYKVNYLHTGVVGLFGCPVEISGEIPSGTALEFTYDPSKLNGIKPEGLIILHYSNHAYDTIPSELDRDNCTVTALIGEGGAYMLADAYEWYRVWGTVIDEFKHDVVFRCNESYHPFSITIPSDVEFNPCGDYLKDSSEPNVREQDLVAGPGVLDLDDHDIVLTMKYFQRTDEITYDENVAGIKAFCDTSDEYSYEDYGEYTIFTSRVKGEPQRGINGSGSTWAQMKITDCSWVYICYTYVYDKIEEYEPQAVNSIKSFMWE